MFEPASETAGTVAPTEEQCPQFFQNTPSKGHNQRQEAATGRTQQNRGGGASILPAAGWKPSGRGHSCPICSRTKDGDCRIGAELILCHYGSSHHPPKGLKPGDVIPGADGQQWAFTRDTSDGRAATFTIHKPRHDHSSGSAATAVGIQFARLPEPASEPPKHWPHGTRLPYSVHQAVVVLTGDKGKSHIPHHRNATGREFKSAGPEAWPLWREIEVLDHGPGRWVIETEGEKCAEWIRAAGYVGTSQPGHDHKVESIETRYRRLHQAGVVGVAYLADNDPTGEDKGEKCQKAAAAAGLHFRLLHAAEIWPDICRGGSIDDAPGSAADRVAAVVTAAQARKPTTTPATPPPAAQQQDKPPASLQALIQRLPDGWGEKGGTCTLSPGRLADMLPAQSFRYNELDLRGEVETSSGWQRITDADMDSAYVLLTGKGWKIGPEAVVKAILHVARQTPVHPVRDYLQRVKADPSITPYDLDQVAPKLFRASQPLHVAMVRKWLIGAAARALQPGCQMDYCLVLKGGQGLLKSTGLKALTSAEWFTSTHADGDKDFLQNVHSCWVYELAELETITSKKQAGALKNLITTATDVFRPPYGRTPERTDRRSVFCATVNKDQFLRDDTGNRRFWVVPIEGSDQLDRDAIAAARDAIWKAAVLAHEAGELPMLSKELEALSAAQNEEYNEQDAWTGMVQAWMDGEPLHRWDPERDPSTSTFDPAGAFSSAEILYSAGLKRTDAITRADEMRLGEVLKGLGFASRQRRVRGKVARLWALSQPVPTVTTSTAEVVTPQTLSGAMDLPSLSRPSQPKTRSKGLKRGEEVEGGAARVSTFFETRGCDTPFSPAGSLPAQSVCPVTTSLSQPPAGCDTPSPYELGDLVDVIAPDGNWRNGFRVLDVVETSAATRYRVEGATAGYNVTGDQLRPSVEAA
jgi:hypothetical protein